MAFSGVSSVIGTFSGMPYTVQLLLKTICGWGAQGAGPVGVRASEAVMAAAEQAQGLRRAQCAW